MMMRRRRKRMSSESRCATWKKMEMGEKSQYNNLAAWMDGRKKGKKKK